MSVLYEIPEKLPKVSGSFSIFARIKWRVCVCVCNGLLDRISGCSCFACWLGSRGDNFEIHSLVTECISTSICCVCLAYAPWLRDHVTLNLKIFVCLAAYKTKYRVSYETKKSSDCWYWLRHIYEVSTLRWPNFAIFFACSATSEEYKFRKNQYQGNRSLLEHPRLIKATSASSGTNEFHDHACKSNIPWVAYRKCQSHCILLCRPLQLFDSFGSNR